MGTVPVVCMGCRKCFRATPGYGYRPERPEKSETGNRSALLRAYVIFDSLGKLRVDELDRKAFFEVADHA